MDLFNTFFFAFFAGVLPAVIWLVFWLREDADHPEPPKYVLMTFAYGALAVPFALVMQLIFNALMGIPDTEAVKSMPFFSIIAIVTFWALAEEYVKYRAAWNGGLKKTITDEAVDVPIYMISAALGFAALENSLFLIEPFLKGEILNAVMTTKARFIGATLVHVASSSIIGLFAGYSLFFAKKIKRYYLVGGFILSVLLHATFNLFIINSDRFSDDDAGLMNLIALLIVWFFIILIIISFERIKKIKLNTINNVREEKKENTD